MWGKRSTLRLAACRSTALGLRDDSQRSEARTFTVALVVVACVGPGLVALAKVTWLCVRGLGRLTILRLPACVSTLDFALKSYGPEEVWCDR